jgi:two-component sensor histidine kinase
VAATVELSQSDAPEHLKAAICGRIQALANVHALFVESRWSGAELHQIAEQEFSPYHRRGVSLNPTRQANLKRSSRQLYNAGR